MTTVERSIELAVPASSAYNLWTQFELFPHFMSDVEDVRQIDDRHLHWRTRLFGKEEEWDAEITEQIPDKRIAWRSVDHQPSHAGVVTFHRLSDDTSRVMLQMQYEPTGAVEKIGDAVGLAQRRIQTDLDQFKAFAEQEGDRAEGWRGEIPAKQDAAQQRKPE